MKRVWMILFAALFVMPLALAEETFFEEASFDTGANAAGDETFFEESGFFADDGFFSEVTEIGLQEDAVQEASEDDLEERTLLAMNYTGDEGSYMFSGTPLEIAPILLTPCVIDAKPNQVRLEWQHYYRNGDYYSTGNPEAVKSVKLPKGVAYYVYERDKYFGIWHQVAKTTKRTVTLKNRTQGNHEYFVRAEYTGKGGEQYGDRSYPYQYVDIQDVGMWKAFSKISLVQRSTTMSNVSGIDPIVRIRSKEPADYIYLTFTVKYQSGKSISHDIEYGFISPYWNPVAIGSGYEYEVEINLNDTYFTGYSSNDILLKGTSDYAKSISVKAIPAMEKYYMEYIDGKKATASLKKIYYNSDIGKAKPIIHSVYQRGLDFQMNLSFSTPYETYGIWDGKKFLTTYWPYNTNPYIIDYLSLDKEAKPGAHKISVAKCEWDPKKSTYKAVGDKTTYTLNVPSPEKAPVTIGSDLQYSSGSVSGTFWNRNPKIQYFWIQIYDNSGYLAGEDYYSVKTNSLAAKGVGYDDYSFSTSVTGAGPFRVTIKSIVLNKKTYEIEKQFISDVYLTNKEIIPLKR